ncbi:MAG: DUF3098 domain-containing protein [Chitinophagales bacterium]
METKKQPAVSKPASSVSSKKMALGRENYYLIILGAVVLVIGFILMSGGKYTDPEVFNGDELYSTRRITIAPIVVILGFIIEVYAIFHKSKKD